VAAGAITEPRVEEVPVYAGDVGDHSESTAFVVVFTRR